MFTDQQLTYLPAQWLARIATVDVSGQPDVVPVVFGSDKRYFGSIDRQYLLEDPHVIIQGDRVLHLRFKVRR